MHDRPFPLDNLLGASDQPYDIQTQAVGRREAYR
jgi:hypothetical protein